jgi:hypothetical protein
MAERIGIGLIIFTVGFSKKVLLADPLAEFVDPLFVKGCHRSTGLRRRLERDAWFQALAESRTRSRCCARAASGQASAGGC